MESRGLFIAQKTTADCGKYFAFKIFLEIRSALAFEPDRHRNIYREH